jgi:hypothetical protein
MQSRNPFFFRPFNGVFAMVWLTVVLFAVIAHVIAIALRGESARTIEIALLTVRGSNLKTIIDVHAGEHTEDVTIAGCDFCLRCHLLTSLFLTLIM